MTNSDPLISNSIQSIQGGLLSHSKPKKSFLLGSDDIIFHKGECRNTNEDKIHASSYINNVDREGVNKEQQSHSYDCEGVIGVSKRRAHNIPGPQHLPIVFTLESVPPTAILHNRIPFNPVLHNNSVISSYLHPDRPI